ncbi:hypothetical protein TNCV_4868971 [Trichonephila clavipes]|nr:hypothetical protein TNCV_4868971 [Trichonephila clavipes]
MFDSTSYDNLTPLAHADASRDVLPRGVGLRIGIFTIKELLHSPGAGTTFLARHHKEIPTAENNFDVQFPPQREAPELC